MKNLAILSRNDNAYSETFISAHKKLPFNIFFYCQSVNDVPSQLTQTPKVVRVMYKVFFKLKSLLNNKLSRSEYALEYFLKRDKIDCILAEYGVTAAASLQVIQSLQLPLIVHFHGFDASDRNILRKYKEKYIEMFAYAQFVVSVSKKMSADLMTLGCPAGKIILNPYGPNADFFNIEPALQKLQFIAVGRFVDKKAPHLTIMAFSKVANKHPEARLLLGGQGRLLSACKELVKELGIDEQVIFLGRMSPSEIMSYFSTSLAFVQHSITAPNGDSEGTPVAILEASAAGLPVIATRHAGIPDVVKHGKTGFLVEEQDVEGMADYMMYLYENPEKAKAMGMEGSQNIRVNFTIEKHLNYLTEIIIKSMGENSLVRKSQIVVSNKLSRLKS